MKRKKKKTGYLIPICLAFFGLVSLCRADDYTVITGATADATGVFIDSFGTNLGPYIDISGYTKVLVGAKCSAACPAVVQIYVQVATTAADAIAGTFQTNCTIVNIASPPAQPQCIGPGAGILKITTIGASGGTYASGTYSVSVRAIK